MPSGLSSMWNANPHMYLGWPHLCCSCTLLLFLVSGDLRRLPLCLACLSLLLPSHLSQGTYFSSSFFASYVYASTQGQLLSLWYLAAALCIWHVEPFSVWHDMPFWLHLYSGGCCAPRKFVVNSVHHAQDGNPSSGRRAQQQCREWKCQFLCSQLSPLFSSLGRTAFSFIKWLIITLSFEHFLILTAFSQFFTSTRELGRSDPSWACHSTVLYSGLCCVLCLCLPAKLLTSWRQAS